MLEYVATLPCNLSLVTCFLTLMFHKVVWHITNARCGGIFNNHFTANLAKFVIVAELNMVDG